MNYIDIAEARGASGLRLVLTAGVPGPWGESAKYIFHVKKLSYLPVRQTPGESEAALREWTAQTSAPVAVYEDERPRSSWAEILYLAERLAPEPALIPADPEERIEMFGLCHEICGDQGFGWQRRLMLLHPALASGQGDSVTALLFQSWKPEADRDEELIERSRFRAGVLYDFMEHQLDGRTWLMGDHFSLADCAAAPPLFYAQQSFPFAGRKNIEAYWERLQERDCYQKVAAERDPVLAQVMAARA